MGQNVLNNTFNVFISVPGNTSSRRTLDRSPSNANSKNQCPTPTSKTTVTAIPVQPPTTTCAVSTRDLSQQVLPSNNSQPIIIPPVHIVCAPPSSLSPQSHPSPYLDTQ